VAQFFDQHTRHSESKKKAKKGSREKPDYSNSHNAERVVYLRDFIDGVESF
jgi:hypothetical protein